HQHHGHTHDFGVVLYVEFVFDVLDDRNEDAGVALPEEDAFNGTVGHARDEILDLAIVIGEHHHRNIQPSALDFGRQFGCIHVLDFEVGDNQVEAVIRASEGQRL